jgi:GNAT superfamily N-acetyltransferase
MEIRRAEISDAPSIATIQVIAWRTAYQGLVPQALLDDLSVSDRSDRWKRIIANPASNTRVWVADEGQLVGFASTGPTEDEGAPDGTAELFTLYLDPAWIGKGVGRALETAALSDLRDQGFRAVTLWVLQGNSNARVFYERGGWELDGEARTDELGPQVRYRMAFG